MKEAFEQFTKTNTELMAKALSEDPSKLMMGSKRPREMSSNLNYPIEKLTPAPPEGESPPLPPPKKIKGSQDGSRPPTPASSSRGTTPTAQSTAAEQEGVDIEALLPPSTVVKATSVTPEKAESVREKSPEPVKEIVMEEISPVIEKKVSMVCVCK